MSTNIKIRSIYSTALTRLVLDAGYTIVEPSTSIRERFGLEYRPEPYELLIQDREDLQGVEVFGQPEKMCQILSFFQERLFDPVLLDLEPMEDDDSLLKAKIEFPGASKARLDEIRYSVTPTLVRHHRLRIINSQALERAEITLMKHPEKKSAIEKRVFLETIFLPLEKAGLVKLEHMRPSGKPMRPREGILVEANSRQVVFRRSFSKGRYDGLDLPIQEGDYGLTEISEGEWFVRHSYYTRQDKLIGEYYNVNTPVELYPYGARYLDLEIDVIRKAGESPSIIDREKLAFLTRQGSIGSELEIKAVEVAESLAKSLNSEPSQE